MEFEEDVKLTVGVLFMVNVIILDNWAVHDVGAGPVTSMFMVVVVNSGPVGNAMVPLFPVTGEPIKALF